MGVIDHRTQNRSGTAIAIIRASRAGTTRGPTRRETASLAEPGIKCTKFGRTGRDTAETTPSSIRLWTGVLTMRSILIITLHQFLLQIAALTTRFKSAKKQSFVGLAAALRCILPRLSACARGK